MEVAKRLSLYTQLDKLEKDRNKELEDILINILPEAFAVVKETARQVGRVMQPLKLPQPSLTVNLPPKKQRIIKGDKATHQQYLACCRQRGYLEHGTLRCTADRWYCIAPG
jgi:preprotein translocase subunit SecA